MTDTSERAQQAPEAEGSVPRLRLRSLKVHTFREVRPGTELRFGDGFHLILGKNASGKSTLLELLAAVSTLDFSGAFFAKTPFHIEASFEVGEVSLHAEIRRTFEPQRVQSAEERYLDLPLRDEAETIVRIEHLGAAFRQWVRARTGEKLVLFRADPRQDESTAWSVDPTPVNALTLPVFRVLSSGSMIVESGVAHVQPAVWDSFLRVLEASGTGVPFDEALGALQTMTGPGLTLLRGKNMLQESPWLPRALRFDAQGEPVTCELSKDLLLGSAIRELGFDDAKAYFGPGASAPYGWTYSSPSFQFFRRGKAVRRHDQLSFGQQRLFSFAWYLACNPDVAIADELVNGLHSEWIDWCVEALGDRQCFLTSQNPILVDAVPFGAEEDIRRGIILCEASHDAAGETSELSWRQLDEREAGLIARALSQSRLDLLSDLLQALDLW